MTDPLEKMFADFDKNLRALLDLGPFQKAVLIPSVVQGAREILFNLYQRVRSLENVDK